MIGQSRIANSSKTTCYHCGEVCSTDSILFHEKSFCCAGCKSVYQILEENQLCNYYTITQNPGLSQQSPKGTTYFDFLDEAHVIDKLVHFKNENIYHIKFRIPNMHCSSCIWLLENLNRLHAGVVSSRVTFLEREVQIVFNHEEISLKQLVLLLKKIGYEPNLSLDDLTQQHLKKENRTQLYKIGIAGFCFGNIMMLSFPDYFASGEFLNDGMLNHAFNYVSLSLSLPVFFYCAQEFFISSWQHLKQKRINIDIPIALAILITFLVSLYSILVQHKLGYLDSMSGIVFFMLLGRFFQNRSYNYLTFQRSYASYLPISVNKLLNGVEKNIPLTSAVIGDEIIIRHHEVIPSDAILLQNSAWFDYSFVSGESNWVEKHPNEIVYAGAMLTSPKAQLKISKTPSQSYITQLWNSKQSEKYASNTLFTTERINLYFSATVLILGLLACLYWINLGQATTGLKALVTVWIVACPCALLLSSTFTNGNLLTILAGNGMFVKNAAVLEKLKDANHLVFDKTGTLTDAHQAEIDFIGRDLQAFEWEAVYALANLSIHPLSKMIARYIGKDISLDTEVQEFSSLEGKGISGSIKGLDVQIGSEKWIGVHTKFTHSFTRVFIKLGEEIVGYFEIKNKYRSQIFDVLQKLKSHFKLHLLSGDNNAEAATLAPLFGNGAHLKFNCLPEDKTAYIKALQQKGSTVVMIGDGLNDANAFEQADAGIAVIESEHNYLPSCDVIMKADKLASLHNLLNYVAKMKFILISCFTVSVVYNIIGLSYAMQGKLTPVVAAILMPISTISIIGISFILSRYFAKKHNLSI